MPSREKNPKMCTPFCLSMDTNSFVRRDPEVKKSCTASMTCLLQSEGLMRV